MWSMAITPINSLFAIINEFMTSTMIVNCSSLISCVFKDGENEFYVAIVVVNCQMIVYRVEMRGL